MPHLHLLLRIPLWLLPLLLLLLLLSFYLMQDTARTEVSALSASCFHSSSHIVCKDTGRVAACSRLMLLPGTFQARAERVTAYSA